MSTVPWRLQVPAGRPWLLALVPALIVGIIAMHTLLTQAPADSHAAPAASTGAMPVAAQGHDGHSMAASATDGDEPDGRSHDGGLSDCGGLMTMCMALLISIVAAVLWRRGPSFRVLWQLPPPALVRLGLVRDAFQALSPLQRTTVIRC